MATKTSATETEKNVRAKTATAKKAEEIKEDVKQAVAEKREEMKEAAEKVKEKAKDTTAKAVEKTKAAAAKGATAVRKSANRTAENARKAVKEVKAETKRKVTRKPTKKIVLQYLGKEVTEESLTERAIAQFSALEGGVSVKKITLYLKPEENAAYYVINDQYTGRVDY